MIPRLANEVILVSSCATSEPLFSVYVWDGYCYNTFALVRPDRATGTIMKNEGAPVAQD